jgi:hypothetical protein
MKRCSQMVLSVCAIALAGAAVTLAPGACLGGVAANVGPTTPCQQNLLAEADNVGHQYYHKYGYEYACPEQQYEYLYDDGQDSPSTEAATETPTNDTEGRADVPNGAEEEYDFEYSYDEYLLKYGYGQPKPADKPTELPADKPAEPAADKPVDKPAEPAADKPAEPPAAKPATEATDEESGDSEEGSDESMTPEPSYDYPDPTDKPEASETPQPNAYEYTYPESQYGYSKAVESSPPVPDGAGTCFDHGSVPEEQPRDHGYSGMHEYYGGQQQNGAETDAKGYDSEASQKQSYRDEERFYYDAEPSHDAEQNPYQGVKPSEPFAANRAATGAAAYGALLSLAADGLDSLSAALADLSRRLRSQP